MANAREKALQAQLATVRLEFNSSISPFATISSPTSPNILAPFFKPIAEMAYCQAPATGRGTALDFMMDTHVD